MLQIGTFPCSIFFRVPLQQSSSQKLPQAVSIGEVAGDFPLLGEWGRSFPAVKTVVADYFITMHFRQALNPPGHRKMTRSGNTFPLKNVIQFGMACYQGANQR
ncbi:MAG: hypothetical protein WA510_29810 [Acidobacteriaceae bacterium]